MARKIKSMDDLRLNPFAAVKRAYIFKRGVVAGPQLPAGEQESSAENPTLKKPETADAKPKEEGESYPEKVADGESDKQIEGQDKENEEGLDKLKSEAQGSKTAKGPEELIELTEKSLDVLYEATTVWPFTLFPDTLTLDREKLTIAKRHFWQAATITSVPVGEIMSAEVLVGPFFGSLDLTFRFFTNNERKIGFLRRQDAIELQRLIHGYIIAHRREIDVSSVEKDELISLLSKLGQGATD